MAVRAWEAGGSPARPPPWPRCVHWHAITPALPSWYSSVYLACLRAGLLNCVFMWVPHRVLPLSPLSVKSMQSYSDPFSGLHNGCAGAQPTRSPRSKKADAHRGDGKRYVVRADELLTAFLELRCCSDRSAEHDESHGLKPLRRAGVRCSVVVRLFQCEHGWASHACHLLPGSRIPENLAECDPLRALPRRILGREDLRDPDRLVVGWVNGDPRRIGPGPVVKLSLFIYIGCLAGMEEAAGAEI